MISESISTIEKKTNIEGNSLDFPNILLEYCVNNTDVFISKLNSNYIFVDDFSNTAFNNKLHLKKDEKNNKFEWELLCDRTILTNIEIIDSPEVSNFHYMLKMKQNTNGIDDSLEFVFDYLDDLLLSNKFNTCNKILSSIKVDDYNIDILIGILTITFSWKNKLNLRNDFYRRVKLYISKYFKIAEVNEILVGLE